ncbi:MAG TPA: M20 family peptidase, partial [Sphingomicrobium sp.]|nr:M20 family peptidase [Sphingomicrobium sp.]
MFRTATLALAALALVPSPAIAKLSPAESRMIQTVDAEQERTLSMLEKWVNQNSGSLNIEG